MHTRKLTERKLIAWISVMVIIMMAVMSSCTSQNQIKDETGVAIPAEGELTMYFLDVGQADSTILVSDGEAMLVDAGNRDDSNLISGYLTQLGIDELKYIVFTHPHEDHTGSGEALVSSMEVKKIFMLDEYDEGIEKRLKEAITSAGIETEAPRPGTTARLGECTIEFLGPDRGYEDTNDDSICLKVTHGSNRVLFTGDAGRVPEKDMIESGQNLEAELLQAGHHGSSTSNSYYFLRESNPRYVVISCGEGNMYGHPHEEALSRFSDLGAEVFRTDEQGTIVAVSDGSEIEFNCEGHKADKPYTKDREEASYIGNVNSRKFHSPDCGGLPDEDNRVYFKTRDAAVKAGYDPCGRCNP
ncbi:MAG: MBL fold metallo-hydrolase [Bacillota bacterium]|nr:MBL fold metallo-hydrolase [Bacillota bacterium]